MGIGTGRTFTLHVSTATGALPVLVERKRVRNFNLRVRADGSVYLSIPLRAPVTSAEDFLERRASWIAEHVTKRCAQAAQPVRTLYNPADGSMPLWGKLVVLEDALREAGIGSDVMDAARGATSGSAAAPIAASELVEQLYRVEVARTLPTVAARAEAATGAHAAHWQVRRMTSRWGSCTPARKSIRISTGLAAYPPACLAMVVAHELVHLHEPSHNARFHALLDAAYPANREVARLLKQPPRAVAERATAESAGRRT